MKEESAKCLLAQPIKPREVCHFHISGPANVSLLVGIVFKRVELGSKKIHKFGTQLLHQIAL